MNRTPVFAAVLILVAAAVDAQPTTLATTSGPGFELGIRGSASQASDLGGLAVVFGGERRETTRAAFSFSTGTSDGPAVNGPATVRLALTSAVRGAGLSWSANESSVVTFWKGQLETPKPRTSDVDWLGLLTENVRIDGTMHMFRLTEKATNHEIFHTNHFKGYTEAVNGYFTTGGRWSDGDPFVGNNINHPIMGAVYSHSYMNHDRRCAGVGYGQEGYWSCIARASVYSAIASLNWEWNPLMSESALGHVGKFHTCAYGKCAGEGGWSDFLMTPVGGMGIAIAGDIARAKLWPTLDRHLSGNIAARILKTALKVATDPSGMANAAFNADFRGVLSSRPSGRR